MSRRKPFDRLSRREFVRLSAASAGAVAAAGLAVSCADQDAGTGPWFGKGGNGGGKGGGGGGGTTNRNPLYVPQVEHPAGGLVTLDAAPASVDLGGGRLSNVWAYNGSLPGPTLEVNSGEWVDIDFINNLEDESVTHWHGMIVEALNDGHPRHAIQPGQTKSYGFEINQRACLNWYHPHPHGKTGEQVNMGLAGAFIVRDTNEAALGLPSGSYEVPLIIRDARFDKSGNIQYQAKRGGYEGNVPLVNGTLDPSLAVDQGVYRFRVLNGSNARIYRFALSDARYHFVLIGNDGGLVEASWELDEIVLSPGERLDLLIDFSALAAGDPVMLVDLDSGWDLLEFKGTGAAGYDYSVPQQLTSITHLSNPVLTREFSFDGMSRINGQVYEMMNYDLKVPWGQTERWVFRTNGNAPHPVHVHAAPFQVQARSGGRGKTFPWENGWKDTVLLEDGETVEVLVRFDHETLKTHGPTSQGGAGNIYLLHCHKLEHEDMGMMMNFEII